MSRHICDTTTKNYDTALRLYKVNQTFYYRRRHKQKLFRISLRTKILKVALHRKRLLDFIKGDELFKMKSGDYELVFEYDTQEELESYLNLANKIEETRQYSKSDYETVTSRIEKEASRDYGDDLNFFNLEYKFIDAKRKADKVSTSTYTAYKTTFKKLREYFYKKEIVNITLEDYEDFREHLIKKDKLKNVTVNTHMIYTNKFLEFAVDRKIIPENNLKGIESLKEEETEKENFTDEDIKNILAYEYNEPTVENFFLIAMYSGMRQEDIHRLKKENIMQEEGIYFFNITEGKTGNSVRKVPIHESILDDVLKMDFPIFKDKTINAVQKLVNRRLYKVIDEKSTKSFHTFRATFIEKAVNAYPDKLALVQEVVGHSKNDKDKLTVDRYAKGFKLSLKVDIVNSVKYNLND